MATKLRSRCNLYLLNLVVTSNLNHSKKAMIIKDLTYLEVVTESAEVEGGILNIGSFQVNLSEIKQFANASAGNGLLGAGNITAAANVAAPIQTNS